MAVFECLNVNTPKPGTTQSMYNVSTMDEGGFEWDSFNIEHIKQHTVSPSEAEQVITNDPLYPPENPPNCRWRSSLDCLRTDRAVSLSGSYLHGSRVAIASGYRIRHGFAPTKGLSALEKRAN